jgi:hypothetical protein
VPNDLIKQTDNQAQRGGVVEIQKANSICVAFMAKVYRQSHIRDVQQKIRGG